MFRKYILFFTFSVLASQDIAGSYQFYGLYIIHQSLARYDTPIIVNNSELGIAFPVYQIDAGEIYKTTYQGPYGHLYAEALNLILNVNFNSDGTGDIAEGSYYPTETIENCIAGVAILPITDNLLYTSNLDANLIIPSTNIIGSVPDADHEPLPFAGALGGSMSLSQSIIFDYFPSSPIQPTLCDGAGNCFDVVLPDGEVIPGGQPLPGLAGGYVLMGDLPTIAPLENENSDLYMEWHAIDGPISESGLGDIIGEDEDGDGKDFDRIWGLEALTATYLNSSCGYNYPVFGDVADEFNAKCLDRVDIANEGYIMDPAFSNWGNFLTYNALIENDVDDSDHDYNGTDGRIIMEFTATCIQDINIRHIMLEFQNLDDDCPALLGDLNCDGDHNVLDIVTLANCILSQNCATLPCGCAGDLNDDDAYNVLDIVSLANCILAQNCSGRVDDARSGDLILQDNALLLDADGFIGGVQMTLKHSDDFTLQLTDKALHAGYVTQANETRLIIVTPKTAELFTYTGEFEIIELIAANSQSEVAVHLPTVVNYTLSGAYPNPFNPRTTMKLTMPVSGEIKVEVYNLLGQVVSTLANGYMEANTYTLTWDGSEVSSGMYFVKAEIGGVVQTQKLLLLK